MTRDFGVSSIDHGDVVLSNLPPYSTQPWLSMGVAMHASLLAGAGIRARVVRPTEPTAALPASVEHASLTTFTFDPSIDERLDAMDAAYRSHPAFFDGIVEELLRGGEDVVGLSVFRNNVDVTLAVARLLKERRPDVRVVIGGPEAIEAPEELLLSFVDCVVGLDAERVMVPLFRALLDRTPSKLSELRSVWSHVPSGTHPMDREALPLPELPVIDYAPLMGLLVGEAEPTVPLLLNWGCPYRCSYCSNRSTYSRFAEGSIERLVAEMDGAVAAWHALHEGATPPLNLQLSDATTNALPGQLDTLLGVVRDRIPRWGMRPSLRGQTLFDARITEERVRLFRESGFHGTFFGVDAVGDAHRRSLKRPGSTEQMREAVRTWIQGGLGEGLGMGIPVGMPGETDDDFEQACGLVDFVLSLGQPIQSITVLPYVFFRSAQDAAFRALNQGPPRGVLWRSPAPGGDPAVRAHRMMSLYDRVAGRAAVMSPIPPYLALPAMLPDEEPARLEAWLDRHGRVFDQIRPNVRAQSARHGEPAAEWARALDVLSSAGGAWVYDSFVYDGGQLTVVFRDDGGRARLVMRLAPRASEKRSFGQTSFFDVSYLNRWEGLPCAFDEPWVRARIDELRAREAA